METGSLRPSDDVAAGSWIAPRLRGAFGAVTLAVPSGYPAYARICHPATDAAGQFVSWSEVARETGRRAHPTMQWHALVGSDDSFNFAGSVWPGGHPARGHLEPDVLSHLCDVLANRSTTPERCVFAVWEGYGWFSPEERSRPKLQLPDRNYLLFTGPLQAALQFGWRHGADHFVAQSPNLFWPADRAWCVASEIDFDSTLVGGTPELIDALLGAPTLDVWPVQPDDSLAADADVLNPVPS